MMIIRFCSSFAGEGTFGYKHLVPYFQIAQNKKKSFCSESYWNVYVRGN